MNTRNVDAEYLHVHENRFGIRTSLVPNGHKRAVFLPQEREKRNLTLISKFLVCLAPTEPTSSMANPACITARWCKERGVVIHQLRSKQPREKNLQQQQQPQQRQVFPCVPNLVGLRKCSTFVYKKNQSRTCRFSSGSARCIRPLLQTPGSHSIRTTKGSCHESVGHGDTSRVFPIHIPQPLCCR